MWATGDLELLRGDIEAAWGAGVPPLLAGDAMGASDGATAWALSMALVDGAEVRVWRRPPGSGRAALAYSGKGAGEGVRGEGVLRRSLPAPPSEAVARAGRQGPCATVRSVIQFYGVCISREVVPPWA